jgi:hypothetical protein
MPMYEYVCEAGHNSEHLVKLDGTNVPVRCTVLMDPSARPGHVCDRPIRRVMSVPSGTFPGADSWRK